MTEEMQRGIVVMWNPVKRFGFIRRRDAMRETGNDVLFRLSAVMSMPGTSQPPRAASIMIGQFCDFEADATSTKGRASRVHLTRV